MFYKKVNNYLINMLVQMQIFFYTLNYVKIWFYDLKNKIPAIILMWFFDVVQLNNQFKKIMHLSICFYPKSSYNNILHN